MILDGKALAKKITQRTKEQVTEILNTTGKTLKLAVVLVGNNEASKVYVKNKKIACTKAGIISEIINLDQNVTQKKLEQTLSKLNNDTTVTGILLQLPLPKHLNERSALNCISATKDVDGLVADNLGKLITKETCLHPCTPTGIMELLNEYKIDVTQKNVVIVNHSILVGKPLSVILTQKLATVTVCHHKTKDVSFYTKNADIVITAVGTKNFLKPKMIKKGAVVIDVAIIRDADKLCGDANYEKLFKKASYITPVPGGVGPLTVAALLINTVKAFKLQHPTK